MIPALRVMLVDDNAKRALWVEACLHKAGFSDVRTISCGSRLLMEISDWNPEVIVIDMASPDRDLLESLSIVTNHNPTPIVMFSHDHDPEYIEHAVEAGVSTYVVDGIQEENVRPIIEVAMLQFKSFQQVRRERDDARSELEERRCIDQAKYLIMKQRNINEEQAYAELRKQAMNLNIRMADLARSIIRSAEEI